MPFFRTAAISLTVAGLWAGAAFADEATLQIPAEERDFYRGYFTAPLSCVNSISYLVELRLYDGENFDLQDMFNDIENGQPIECKLHDDLKSALDQVLIFAREAGTSFIDEVTESIEGSGEFSDAIQAVDIIPAYRRPHPVPLCRRPLIGGYASINGFRYQVQVQEPRNGVEISGAWELMGIPSQAIANRSQRGDFELNIQLSPPRLESGVRAFPTFSISHSERLESTRARSMDGERLLGEAISHAEISMSPSALRNANVATPIEQLIIELRLGRALYRFTNDNLTASLTGRYLDLGLFTNSSTRVNIGTEFFTSVLSGNNIEISVIDSVTNEAVAENVFSASDLQPVFSAVRQSFLEVLDEYRSGRCRVRVVL